MSGLFLKVPLMVEIQFCGLDFFFFETFDIDSGLLFSGLTGKYVCKLLGTLCDWILD